MVTFIKQMIVKLSAVSWVVTPYVGLSVSNVHTAFVYNPGDRDGVFLRDVGTQMQVHTVPQPRRLSTTLPPQEPHI
jgi:hypothetical protein